MYGGRAFLEERAEVALESGIDFTFRYANLDAIATDQMTTAHHDSEDLIVIMHPGWTRMHQSFHSLPATHSDDVLIESTRTTLPERELYQELRIEQLVEYASKHDIPVALAVPSFEKELPTSWAVQANQQLRASDSPDEWMSILHSIQKRIFDNCWECHDDALSSHTAFIRRLTSHDNVYVLPTQGKSTLDSIAVTGSGFGDTLQGSFVSYASEQVASRVSLRFEDGSVGVTLDESEGSRLFHLDSHVPALIGFDSLDDDRKSQLDQLGIYDALKDQYYQSLGVELSRWCDETLENPLLLTLLAGVAESPRKRIMVAGSNLDQCIAGFLPYLAWQSDATIEVLGNYCVSSQCINESKSTPSYSDLVGADSVQAKKHYLDSLATVPDSVRQAYAIATHDFSLIAKHTGVEKPPEIMLSDRILS